ncbi:hypothetical protein HUT06_32775 [Actinomadura sp. NAK00032]|uniref:hypothetical protein n=1 Tax=Actinomadura sp. NAK00032 TaxID=2742128 RepID=UPI00158F9DC5|nr:hypothetical protein [Actinomadura sp. NAK00032]QKW38188.1 hypothetical protein HUT06_32775 [Actinomadura sp. NAK00032]
MQRNYGEKFGRWSLRLDAAYCAVVGTAVALFSGQIAQGIAFSPLLIAAAGIAVVVWAGGIVWMLARLPLRLALRLVMVANVLAATAVGFASAAAATVLIVAAVVTVAVDVALFATSQAIALRKLPAQS